MRKRGFKIRNTDLSFISERSEHIYNARFTTIDYFVVLRHLRLLYTNAIICTMRNASEAEPVCGRINGARKRALALRRNASVTRIFPPRGENVGRFVVTGACDVTRGYDDARLAEGPRRAGSGAWIGRLVYTSACRDAQ